MTQLFTVVLVGRPNVGKSSLFNRLCARHSTAGKPPPKAIVADYEGVTRDLIYGEIQSTHGKIRLIDSPGQLLEDTSLEQLMGAKARSAYAAADLLILVCDGQAGLSGGDQELVQEIRSSNQACLLVVNKMDLAAASVAEFYALGWPVIGVSAKRGQGIKSLIEHLVATMATNSAAKLEVNSAAKLATGQVTTAVAEAGSFSPEAKDTLTLLGCPNAGKSTLANVLLGEDWQLVHHLPGSTRDSVQHDFKLAGEDWALIDTAGIRRKSRVTADLELATVRAGLRAVGLAKVVVYVLDAEHGSRHQDLSLLQLIRRAGRGLIIVVNKMDLLDRQQTKDLKGLLEWELAFIDYAPRLFMSAARGTKLKSLIQLIKQVRDSMATKAAGTALNNHLQTLLTQNPPPLRQGRRSNLRYINQIGINPPHLRIHGKRTEFLPANYKKYLEKALAQRLGLIGAPLELSYQNDSNPYSNRQST